MNGQPEFEALKTAIGPADSTYPPRVWKRLAAQGYEIVSITDRAGMNPMAVGSAELNETLMAMMGAGFTRKEAMRMIIAYIQASGGKP